MRQVSKTGDDLILARCVDVLGHDMVIGQHILLHCRPTSVCWLITSAIVHFFCH